MQQPFNEFKDPIQSFATFRGPAGLRRFQYMPGISKIFLGHFLWHFKTFLVLLENDFESIFGTFFEILFGFHWRPMLLFFYILSSFIFEWSCLVLFDHLYLLFPRNRFSWITKLNNFLFTLISDEAFIFSVV